MVDGMKRSLLLILVVAFSWAGTKSTIVEQTDEELYTSGKAAVERGDWSKARSTFRRYEVRYPHGSHIEEAKFNIAQSYFKSRTTEEQVEGVALFRSFLTFYPQHALACNAQLRIASYYFKHMRGPERDQTEARQALDEAQKLIATYPNCDQLAEAQDMAQKAEDRLAFSEFKVAEYYWKIGNYLAAEHRLRDIIKAYPGYTDRDKAYYYLVDSLQRQRKSDEAQTALQMLSTEHPGSTYFGKAQKAAGSGGK